jgi:trehalose 6-phosphate synthase/phosphatase
LANELVAMLEGMLAETELRAFRGHKLVEVRPLWVNKGEAVGRILAEQGPFDFLFAAGDDRTDEDLFESMPENTWSLHVGPGPTRAAYAVPGVAWLRRILTALAAISHEENAKTGP